MDVFRAAEIAIKNYFFSLLAGTFFISFVGGSLLGADPLTCIFAFFISLFGGGLVVALVAAPIYAGLLVAGIATYYSASLLAALIAGGIHLTGSNPLALMFAAYGVPISVFAHFLTKKERPARLSNPIRPLRG